MKSFACGQTKRGLAGGPDYGVHCTPEGAPSKLRLGGGFPRAWPTLSCLILLNITHAELKPAIYAAFLIDRGRAGLRGSGESRWPGAPSFPRPLRKGGRRERNQHERGDSGPIPTSPSTGKVPRAHRPTAHRSLAHGFRRENRKRSLLKHKYLQRPVPIRNSNPGEASISLTALSSLR
jgi:hypothetical protein